MSILLTHLTDGIYIDWRHRLSAAMALNQFRVSALQKESVMLQRAELIILTDVEILIYLILSSV